MVCAKKWQLFTKEAHALREEIQGRRANVTADILERLTGDEDDEIPRKIASLMREHAAHYMVLTEHNQAMFLPHGQTRYSKTFEPDGVNDPSIVTLVKDVRRVEWVDVLAPTAARCSSVGSRRI